MRTSLWGGVWTKVVGRKTKLSEREVSTYFIDCVWHEAFLALFYAVWVCLSHLSPAAYIVSLLFIELPLLTWNAWRSEERAGGGIVVCIIVAALMLVASLPMHSTLLSLALCIFGSKASDMMMQEKNTRLSHFSRSSEYNVEMIFFMFNILYINK